MRRSESAGGADVVALLMDRCLSPVGSRGDALARLTAVALGLVALGLVALGCGSDPAPDTVTATTKFQAPQDQLDTGPFKPHFEPDFNRLVPRPGVTPVADAERDAADVFPERLELPDSVAGVASWQPGRLVVGAASQGAGRNPMGFARRVVKVEHVGSRFVVATQTVGIEELVEGDFQAQITADNSDEVDLSKADKQWLLANLYDNTPNMAVPLGTLVPDAPVGPAPMGIFDAIGGFFSDAWDWATDIATDAWGAIKKFGADLWKFLTTGEFDFSLSFSETLGFVQDSDQMLWPSPDSVKNLGMSVLSFFKKDVKVGTYNVRVGMDGKLSYRAEAAVTPGIQVYGHFSLFDEPKVGVRLDAEAKIGVKLDMDATVSLESGGKKTAELKKSKGALGKAVRTAAKQVLRAIDGGVGSPNPVAYKWPLYVTKPRVKWIQAGPVPIAIVMAMQVNLECSFAVRADVKVHADVSQSFRFQFDTEFSPSSGARLVTSPSLTPRTTHEFDIQRPTGDIDLYCGLMPRINILLYDALGAYGGVWGGLHAHASVADDCGKPGAEDRIPDAVARGELSARVAVKIGGMKQPPGTSTQSDAYRLKRDDDIKGLKLTVWEHEWPLVDIEYRSKEGGWGYCPATCPNGQKDDDETDLDCGGACSIGCALGKSCLLNSDCVVGLACNKRLGSVCSLDHCGDGVQDAAESDVDCGGPASACEARCADGAKCRAGKDCTTGFCSGGSDTEPRRCATTHCNDGVKDGDEADVDCGGELCARCANGKQAISAADCESGYLSLTWCGAGPTGTGPRVCGGICVATSCDDRLQNGDETDVDCGGSCPNRCLGTEKCLEDSDCAAPWPGSSIPGPICREITAYTTRFSAATAPSKRCLLDDWGPACISGARSIAVPPQSACASGVCDARGFCAPATCSDGIANGTESDVDCGGSCPDRCWNDRLCNAHTDCESFTCGLGHCGWTSLGCADNVLSFGETDIDCGGICAKGCALFRACKVDSDCELGRCVQQGGSSGTCYLPIGLMASWPLHGTDTSPLGVGHPILTLSSPAYVADSHSGGWQSVAFDGSSVWGQVTPMTLGDRFTIAMWAKLSSPVASNWNVLLSSAEAMAKENAGVSFFVNRPYTNDLSLNLQTGDGVDGCILSTAANVARPGQWQHLAITLNRVSQTVAFYVDGLPVASTGCFYDSFTDALAPRVGSFATGEGFLNGRLEDVRVYNYVLDAASILALKRL